MSAGGTAFDNEQIDDRALDAAKRLVKLKQLTKGVSASPVWAGVYNGVPCVIKENTSQLEMEIYRVMSEKGGARVLHSFDNTVVLQQLRNVSFYTQGPEGVFEHGDWNSDYFEFEAPIDLHVRWDHTTRTFLLELLHIVITLNGLKFAWNDLKLDNMGLTPNNKCAIYDFGESEPIKGPISARDMKAYGKFCVNCMVQEAVFACGRRGEVLMQGDLSNLMDSITGLDIGLKTILKTFIQLSDDSTDLTVEIDTLVKQLTPPTTCLSIF